MIEFPYCVYPALKKVFCRSFREKRAAKSYTQSAPVW